MRRLELLSNNGASLVIERDESPEAWWWQVTLSDRDASATTRVDPDGAMLVDEFFADLAREWRGWSGEKIWQPIEGGLRLSARHDGLGHVTLRTTLQQDAYPDGWRFEATLKLDAGTLDATARDAASFIGA